MDINAGILEQMLQGSIKKFSSILPFPNDPEKRKSAAFVIFCMSKRLDIPFEEAVEYYTDGGNDAGIDGLYIDDVNENTIRITLFQGKYYRNLDGVNQFPLNSIEKIISTIRNIFDPFQDFTINEKIKLQLEEVRSYVVEGVIPIVYVVLCNNGQHWNALAQEKIECAQLPVNQVFFEHLNHNKIISNLLPPKKIDTNIRISGKLIEETLNYKRILLGKVNIVEIADLLNTYDNLILEGNIRRFLGIEQNRVNTDIYNTLENEEKRSDFYFFNNGITLICNSFIYNGLQRENCIIKMKDVRIINGGQASKIIAKVLSNPKNRDVDFSSCFVLVRIYEIGDDCHDFIRDVTWATNSQNPVDLSDLHSNDDCQKKLEFELQQLGYRYKRHKDKEFGEPVIRSTILAESVLSIIHKSPHQAKYQRHELFGKLYDKIFLDLDPAQALVCVLIFRHVENYRKNYKNYHIPNFIPYASHYIAMCVGIYLKEIIPDIHIDTFRDAKDILEQKFPQFYTRAVQEIHNSLDALYKNCETISLQQLAATFRRGDILRYLIPHTNSEF